MGGGACFARRRFTRAGVAEACSARAGGSRRRRGRRERSLCCNGGARFFQEGPGCNLQLLDKKTKKKGFKRQAQASIIMGNVNGTSADFEDSCGSYNVTVAVFVPELSASLNDTPFYPINTFSFFNAFVLFCLQGLIFKPISRLLKKHFQTFKSTFYPGDKVFKNEAIARMQNSVEDSLQAASKPFLEISGKSKPYDSPPALPRWARFLQNNAMCFCDPIFAFYHTLFHVAHFVYLLVRARLLRAA